MSFLFMRLLFHDTNIAHIEGLCKFSTNPPHLLLLEELRFLAERRALKFDLIVAHVGTVGERYAILMPRFTKDHFGDELFCVLALIVLVAFAEGGKSGGAALIDHDAHFNDGALYSVRGAETQRHSPALRLGGAVNARKQNKRSGVHVLHLDRIEHVVKSKAENVVMSERNAIVAVAHGNVSSEVFHRVHLSVLAFGQDQL